MLVFGHLNEAVLRCVVGKRVIALVPGFGGALRGMAEALLPAAQPGCIQRAQGTARCLQGAQ
jgi:hypothetical protein